MQLLIPQLMLNEERHLDPIPAEKFNFHEIAPLKGKLVDGLASRRDSRHRTCCTPAAFGFPPRPGVQTELAQRQVR